VAPLNTQGVATFTPTTTTNATYIFHAVYPGDLNYAASSSSGMTIGSDLGIVQKSSTIATAAGGPVVATIALVPYFNYSGTPTFGCSDLSVNAVCRFQPRCSGCYFLANERTKTTMFQRSSGFARSLSPVIWPLPFLMM